MPVNSYSVGRDIVVDIVTATGPLRLRKITGFTAKPVYNEKKITAMDGSTDHVIQPDCWEGSFQIERQGPEVDKYFADLENGYYAGQDIGTNQTISETISEPGGGISQNRYERVQLKLDDAGDWKGDDTVQQTVSFWASRRKKIV